MTIKKAHALGFRLGITQFWDFAPFSFFDRLFIFLYAWVTGFFQKKRLYLVSWQLEQWADDKILVTLRYFSRKWGLNLRKLKFRRFRKFTRRKKLRWLVFRWLFRPFSLNVRFWRKSVKSPLYLFFRRLIARSKGRSKLTRLSGKAFRLLLARCHFRLRFPKRLILRCAKKIRGRSLVRQRLPRNYVRRFFYWRLPVVYLWYIRILRFCANLSTYCSKLIRKNVVVHAINLYGKHFVKFSGFVTPKGRISQDAFHFLVKTLRRDLFAFRFIRGFKDFLYVLILAGKYRESFLLRQWLKYYFEPVSKYALNVSHNRLLKLISVGLVDLQSVSGFLQGFRLEVRGKINGSLRTRTRTYGVAFARQTLDFVTHYNQYSVKTYTGILSFRFWLF